MSVNLQLLGIQAIPRLAKKLSVQIEFPRWSTFFETSSTDFQKILSEAGRIVKQFFLKILRFRGGIFTLTQISELREQL